MSEKSADGRRRSIRWILRAIALFFFAFVMLDFVTYYVRYQRAKAIVEAVDGHGSFGFGWPLGNGCSITLSRPLTDVEFERLEVLNSLAKRDYVMVGLPETLTPQQIDKAQHALWRCHLGLIPEPPGSPSKKSNQSR